MLELRAACCVLRAARGRVLVFSKLNKKSHAPGRCKLKASLAARM
jgi:hypothetical protein